MRPASKADQKAAVDAAAWMFNVVTSVGIIIVNKALMATYGFGFGKNLISFSEHNLYLHIILALLLELNYLPVCLKYIRLHLSTSRIHKKCKFP